MDLNQTAQTTPLGGAGEYVAKAVTGRASPLTRRAVYSPPPPVDLFGAVPDLTAEQAELIRLRQEVVTLRAQLVQADAAIQNQNNAGGGGGINRPTDLERRSAARTRSFHVNNRVGMRRCAWCHSRRELGPHAPYEAPRDFMNCGCSVEEAKFEDSLASNGIGALEPDRRDNTVVRLSKLLRRPLLELLRRRYGYVDGDFDFDLPNGPWKEDKDADWWEDEATEGENHYP